jgi:DNA invertase Pin-like site-specific DNA recombinase
VRAAQPGCGHVAGAIEDVKAIQTAGGSLAFVEEHIDPTGPLGSLVLTVLLAVATLERDNLVTGRNTAKSRTVERGVPIGPTPFGYLRTTSPDLQPRVLGQGPLVRVGERSTPLGGA